MKKILESFLYTIGALIALFLLTMFVSTVNPTVHNILSDIAKNVEEVRNQQLEEQENSEAALIKALEDTDSDTEEEEPISESKKYEEHMNSIKKGLNLDE